MTLVFRSLILLLCLSVPFSAPANAQDEDVTDEIAELSEAYADVEQKLTEQSAELDRVLKLGYGGPALGKDMADIAENVAALEGHLQSLGEQLADLVKKVNYNPIQPFELVVHKDAKDAPPLTGTIQPGDKVYLTAEVQHAVLAEGVETRLSWALMLPDGTASEKLQKSDDLVRAGEGDTYSFGIDTTGMAFGAYEMELVHSVVDQPKKQFTASAKFTLAEVSEVQITKMVVDDERTGDVHQRVLPEGAFPYMFAYFEAPNYVTELSAVFRVYDLTTRKVIYAKKGVKKIKSDVTQQRFGVVLDPAQVQIENGHEYRFDISLADDLRIDAIEKKLKKAEDKVTFFYGEEPKRIKIDKLVVSTDAADKSTPYKIPAAPTLFLSGWYEATQTVDVIDIQFRLSSPKDGEVILEQSIIRENQSEKAMDTVTVPVDTSLLKVGAEYHLETIFSTDDIQAVKSEKKFIYAELPPLDMLDVVKVSGSIDTPGQGPKQVLINKTNPLKLSSKVTFKVPAVYPDRLEGVLYWEIDGNKQSLIPLDGSNSNWGLSFDAGSMGSNSRYEINLVHRRTARSRPRSLYTASFGVSLPFATNTFGGDRPIYEEGSKDKETGERKRLPDWMGYAWVRDKVGIRVRANDFGVKANVTIKAVLKETGQTLISETKSIDIAAKETSEFEWKLDQPALKFDLEAVFPNIEPKRDFKKTIETTFTVKDDKGYEAEDKITTTQWIYFLDSDEEFRRAEYESENVGTILPPSVMTGPYTTTVKGLSFYYTEGLDVMTRPEELETWVQDVGAVKVREDEKRDYFAKTVPVLITLEDSSGKQGVLFWTNYTFTAGLAKPPPDAEGGQ